MKNVKIKSNAAIIAICLCVGAILFAGCDSDESADIIDTVGPCEQLECLNGGDAKKDVELGICRCICPAGYSGTNCETKNPE